MSLTWNQKNQLTHVSGAAAGPIEYRYDAMGRRVSKIVNSVTTNYLYDGLNLIAELDGDNSNAVIAWYVYAGLDRPLARVDASDGSVLYYHQDLLGSVIALTNSSGVVVTQYNYSPFGHTEVIGTDIDQPFRFTGREWDPETGLYYYRARYYSPDMRRFISEDPIRFAGGDVNWYAYVGNNPVNFTDPLGLSPEPGPLDAKDTPMPPAEVMPRRSECEKKASDFYKNCSAIVEYSQDACNATGLIACIATGPGYPECAALVLSGCAVAKYGGKGACIATAYALSKSCDDCSEEK
jgi:RHS repeat-associated protein